MRIGLAIRVFFKALLDPQAATRLEQVLSGVGLPDAGTESSTDNASQLPVQQAARSDALTLLATLQREARFIDIVKEPLGQYSDAQIGAAARDVLRDCGAVLDRLFELKTVVSEQEGAQVDTPPEFDAGRYRLLGNVTGKPPFRGRLVHPGWEANRCELPQWTGREEASRVLAPVEIELI